MRDFNDLLSKAAREGNLKQAQALFEANDRLMQADISNLISLPQKKKDQPSLFESPSFMSEAAENGHVSLLLFFKEKFGLADFHLHSSINLTHDSTDYARPLNPVQTALKAHQLEAAQQLLLLGLSPNHFVDEGSNYYYASTESKKLLPSIIKGTHAETLYNAWVMLDSALTEVQALANISSIFYQDKFAEILKAFTIENNFVLKYLAACVQELNERQRNLPTSSDIAYTLCKEGFFLLVEAIHMGIKIQKMANDPIASENLLRFQAALDPLFALDVEQPILLPKTNLKNREDWEEEAILHLFTSDKERREYLSAFLNKAEMHKTVEKMNAEAPKIKRSLSAPHLFAVVNQPEQVKQPAVGNNSEAELSIAM